MKKLLILISFAAAIVAHGQTLIPAARLRDWTPGSTVGVVGGIPTTRPIGFTLSADTTGVVDATSALQNAINATPENTVLFVPAGTYKIAGLVDVKSNITVRGAGMNSTIFKHISGSQGWELSTGVYQPFTELGNNFPLVTAGKTVGSTSITSADASQMTTGASMMIAAKDSTDQFGNPVTIGSGWSRKQMVKVTGKVGNTVSFWPPLLEDWSATETRAQGQLGGVNSSIQNTGLESFTIELPLSGARPIFMLNMSDTINCWVTEVRLKHAQNYTIGFFRGVNCEFRRNYLDVQNRVSGSNGGGFLIQDGASGVLFEDNIIRTSYPGIQINFGSRGNVFAYNMLYIEVISQGIHMCHGAHPAFNLIEGNIYSDGQADGYFGSASSYTIYRNWITGKFEDAAQSLTYTFSLKRFSRDFSLVGNILNNPTVFIPNDPIIRLGWPHIGNEDFVGHAPPWVDWQQLILPNGYHEFDDQVAATTIQKVNYSFAYGSIIPGQARAGEPFPNSLFRTSKPTYFGNLTWPPFNPEAPGDLTGSVGWMRIPAGYRFITGNEVPPSGGDTTPPTLSGPPSINAAGTTLTVNFSEPVSIGSGGAGGWTISASGGAATLTNPSGTNAISLTLPISRAIQIGEAVTVSYTQPGNGIEDVGGPGNDLASVTNVTTTNNSQQGGTLQVATPVISLPSGAYFGTQNTTIVCATSGAAIYYTLDGSIPTAASSLYSSGVPLPNSATLRAIGIKAGSTDSTIASATYEINQWTITDGTKTFVVPQKTANFTWTFTVVPQAGYTTAISMGPNPVAQPTDWSMCVAFFDTGAVQVKNNATFAATSVFNWTGGTPYTVAVSCNMTAKTYSVTVNGTTVATNYAFADGQPTATELDNVGLYKSGSMTAGSVVSNMTFTLPPGVAIGIETINVQGIKVGAP